MQQWNQAQIHEYLLQHDFKWIFNPPAASDHGGAWERCIRTVRKVMKALLKEQVLDDEGLCTLMCEVESIVNGRSITKVSDDPRDCNGLTPNHFEEDQQCYSEHFQERITTAVADGAKYSISATCFGNDGRENIYLRYSNAKSGTSHREISL